MITVKKPLLSIVTVSYNAAESIGNTIRSVARQSWTDFEYLFIDGASKDATVAEIESQREAFASRGIPYRVISEPDRGIYDAMNKAIALAEGQWVLMLNAGDLLAEDTVLERVFREPCDGADVLYGHMVVAEESRQPKTGWLFIWLALFTLAAAGAPAMGRPTKR